MEGADVHLLCFDLNIFYTFVILWGKFLTINLLCRRHNITQGTCFPQNIYLKLGYCVPCQLLALIINCLDAACGWHTLPGRRESRHQQRGISQAGDQLPTRASSLLYIALTICLPVPLKCFHSDEKIIGKRVMMRSWK